MALYELRTYTLHVGKMAEAVKLYQEIGFPALQKGGQDKKLVGYFRATRVRSTSLYTSGNSTMTPIVVRIGQPCTRTRISSRASPRNSALC
jgi:NIPSNAP